eukprot:4595395-Karenia_brevis.AAC.1
MTCIFKDVDESSGNQRGYFGSKRIELLYADDTIMFYSNHQHISKVLKCIEEVAFNYGLTLNTKKCVHVQLNTKKRILFGD